MLNLKKITEENAETLLIYVDKNCDAVKKLPKQLTPLEAQHLIDRYSYQDTVNMLDKMNNYAKLVKTYRSVFLTCMKWFELDIKNGYRKAPVSQKSGKPINEMDFRKQKFLDNYPIGSEFTAPNGQKYRVSTDTHLQNINTGAVTPIGIFLNN